MDLNLTKSVNVKSVFNIDNELFEAKSKDFAFELRAREKLEELVLEQLALDPERDEAFKKIYKVYEEMQETLVKLTNSKKSGEGRHTAGENININEDPAIQNLMKEMEEVYSGAYNEYLGPIALDLISKYDLNLRLHIGFPDGDIINTKVYAELLQEIFSDEEILFFSTQLMMNRHRNEKKAKQGPPMGMELFSGESGNFPDMLKGFLGIDDDDDE